MRTRSSSTGYSSLSLVTLLALLLPRCASENGPTAVPTDDAGSPVADVGVDAGVVDAAEPIPPPTPDFARHCEGRDWKTTLEPATLDPLLGRYVGYLDVIEGTPLPAGTLESMKIVPEHPFHVLALRVAFARGRGPARVRLMGTFGRSHPSSFEFHPRLDDISGDLLPPQDIEVDNANPETWLEIDVSSHDVFLLPTEHYMLVYEHLARTPNLALETTPEGTHSRGLLVLPTTIMAYGLGDANYRMQVVGNTFCQRAREDRSFREVEGTAFADAHSPHVGVVDVNGDGHDDVFTTGRGLEQPSELGLGGPRVFLGDGKGGFHALAENPVALAADRQIVFADVDNDGDRDVFAMAYVARDEDGDGYQVGGTSPADCNDANAEVHPRATETTNGWDDDCDGIADDGTDAADADGDALTIAEGDCDDSRADVHPGAAETLDHRDDDCDGSVDEDFVHRILLNDGQGAFHLASNSGDVAALEPATSGAFGDGDGDGNLDYYLGNWLVHYPNDRAVQGRYLQGNGDGTFADAHRLAGLYVRAPRSAYGVAWTDYDNDGFPDIYVSNYHMYANQLWRNTGTGEFVDVAERVGVAYDDVCCAPGLSHLKGGHSYTAAWGDVDNDGDMDMFLANLAHPRVQPWSDRSMFLINEGAPDFHFVDATTEAGFIYDEGDAGAAFADFDNDGDLDLVVTSLYDGHFSRFYRNEGGTFLDITYETGTAVEHAVTATWSDVDEDGDMDLLVGDRNGSGTDVHLFINEVGSENAWLELDLEGTTVNRDAVGARVTVRADDLTMIRDVSGGGGFANPQQSHILHFGLGETTAIDEVTVRWGAGKEETILGAIPRARFRVVEGSGVADPME